MELDKKTQPFARLLGILILLFVFSVIVSGKIDQIEDFIRSIGSYGVLVSIVIYCLLGASPLPSEPITILIGSIYGPLLGTIIATTGNFLAAMIEFLFGKNLGQVVDLETLKARLPARLSNFPIDSPIVLIFGRMLPSIGPKCISLICGISQVKIWRYIWTAFISNLIGAVVFSYGGYGLTLIK